MKKQIRNIAFVAAVIALISAIIFFVLKQYSASGLSLTFFWLLSAAGFMQVKSLKKFAYTLIILSAVSISLTYPQSFISVGDFQFKKLIVPLLQIITFASAAP